jgi:hypothetical protein
MLPRAYHWLDAIPHLTARTVRGIERALMTADRAIPVETIKSGFLRAQAPDFLLISPLVTPHQTRSTGESRGTSAEFAREYALPAGIT